MKSVRRPVVAVSTMLVLVALQAVADPTGLLALVGWSGALPRFDAGAWPFAPYLVFVPVLLAVTWWAAARAGDRFWTLTAVFSIVLAFMNILPIPALDGGHALFCIYEIITGRKPTDKFMEYAQMVGMVLLLGLMAYALGLDLFRMFK